MNEVDKARRAVNDGHPHLASDLVGRGLFACVVNSRALDAIPDGFPALGPLHQPLDAFCDVPQIARHLRLVVCGGVDIE